MSEIIYKLCRKCNETKPVDAFTYDKTRKDGRYLHCRECEKKRMSVYRKTDKGYHAKRRYHLKSEYDLTPEGWENMFDSQGRKCKLCGSDEPKGGQWCVDHDHGTGAVCGIICKECNTVCGKMGDDPRVAAQFLAYLETTRQSGDPQNVRTLSSHQ